MKLKHLFTLLRVSLILLFIPVLFTKTLAREPLTEAIEQNNQSERIISFHTDIRIDTSGMMYLSEKIKIYTSGDQIKRGIVRSIPVYRKDIFGDKKSADFKITSILKDGIST